MAGDRAFVTGTEEASRRTRPAGLGPTASGQWDFVGEPQGLPGAEDAHLLRALEHGV